MKTNEAKHTPGPWVYTYGAVYQGDNAETVEEKTGRLLLADRDNPHTSPTERDANCRLAASAPDLLRQRNELKQALKNCRESMILLAALAGLKKNSCVPFAAHDAQARTALARADGESLVEFEQ